VATGLVNPTVSPGVPVAGGSPALLTLCRHDGVDEPLEGDIEAYDRSGFERTLNLVSMQNYLDGVVPAEESASWGHDGGSTGAPQGEDWGFQALEAQAVAARSYALAYGVSRRLARIRGCL
jgi:peptidoglycan hydrolase-like amidase